MRKDIEGNCDLTRTSCARIKEVTDRGSGLTIRFKESESYQECSDKWAEFVTTAEYLCQSPKLAKRFPGLTWCPFTGTIHTCGAYNPDHRTIKASINGRAVAERGYGHKYKYWSPKHLKRRIATPFQYLGLVRKYQEYQTPYEIYVRDRLGISIGKKSAKSTKKSAFRKLIKIIRHRPINARESSFFQMILGAKRLSEALAQ